MRVSTCYHLSLLHPAALSTRWRVCLCTWLTALHVLSQQAAINRTLEASFATLRSLANTLRVSHTETERL